VAVGESRQRDVRCLHPVTADCRKGSPYSITQRSVPELIQVLGSQRERVGHLIVSQITATHNETRHDTIREAVLTCAQKLT